MNLPIGQATTITINARQSTVVGSLSAAQPTTTAPAKPINAKHVAITFAGIVSTPLLDWKAVRQELSSES